MASYSINGDSRELLSSIPKHEEELGCYLIVGSGGGGRECCRDTLLEVELC